MCCADVSYFLFTFAPENINFEIYYVQEPIHDSSLYGSWSAS